jgi:hypothetical protein
MTEQQIHGAKESEQTQQAPGYGSSGPWLCGAFTSNALYKRFGDYSSVVWFDEVKSAIETDKLSWRKRWWLWPFGYGALVEWYYPALRTNAAARLHENWVAYGKNRIFLWERLRDKMLAEGRDAELTVQNWIDNICGEKASGHMACTTPKWRGIEDIVFPPTAQYDVSQEIDNLIITDHGVYVVEVKNWKRVDERGHGRSESGEDLGSPIEQSRHKAQRIRKILADLPGLAVPVHTIGVLPRLQTQDLAFTVDARIIGTQAELSTMLRGAHQRNRGREAIDVELVAQTLEQHMDLGDGAKIRHLRWLGGKFESPSVMRILDLHDAAAAMREQIEQKVTVEPRRRRPAKVFLATFMSLFLWAGWKHPGAHVLITGAPTAQATPGVEQAKKTGAKTVQGKTADMQAPKPETSKKRYVEKNPEKL